LVKRVLRRERVEHKATAMSFRNEQGQYHFVRYGDYRERSLRSLTMREFIFIVKSLLYDAEPEG
jgi:hypothetical protein